MDASGAQETPLDVVAVGELVVDFISVEQTDTLGNATTFRRYLGGSPANIAVYVSKLGGSAAIISKTGIGAFGKFLKSQLARHGVITNYLIMDHRTNTTIVFVSSTSGTPDFEEFRSGDYLLSPGEVSEEAIERARVVHSSAFALSREPCRSAVFEAFRRAREGGKVVSFDPNYSRRVWPDHKEARKVLREAYGYVDVTKPSLDDAGRIFGREYEPADYLKMFHEMGPRTVILTMGRDGTLVSEEGEITGYVPARPVEAHDATGAGDAFWAGFLAAMLDGEPPMRCALFAREIAEMKLERVGPLPDEIDREPIYARLEEIRHKEASAKTDGAR
jgi:sugar/nucleoside kinase (ribokinase family)